MNNDVCQEGDLKRLDKYWEQQWLIDEYHRALDECIKVSSETKR